MKIDERALEAAFQAVRREYAFSRRDLIQTALEAYEAARPDPNPWRPIDLYDRESDDGNWILVHKDQQMPGSYDLMFWDEIHEWCVAGGDRTYTHADLVHRDAKYRTIDPPS